MSQPWVGGLASGAYTLLPRSLGWQPVPANALAAVGGALSLIVVFTFAYISDKTNRRGATVIAAQCCYLAALVIARQVHPHVGQWSRWALWTLVNSFAVGYHPVHNTWVQVNCRTPGERSVSIAYVSPAPGLPAHVRQPY